MIRYRPYLIPQSSRIIVNEWLQYLSDESATLEHSLPNWDAGTDIHVEAEVALDVIGIYTDCRFAPDAGLRLVLLWHSAGTKLRGCAGSMEITNHVTSGIYHLRGHVAGTSLAEKVAFCVKLLFITGGSTPHRLVPKWQGSILWESAEHVVQLEGEGPRLPTEIIDFSTTHFPKEAGWYFDWEPMDLQQSLLGTTRLYINSQHQQIATAITNPQPESIGIREAIRLDVVQTLVRGALANDDFVSNPNQYARDTVGAWVRATIRTYFTGYRFSDIRAMLDEPHVFSAHLQDKLRIFQT
ncbi:hypothetical protein HC928_03270 [bacterium]|nr:hypothetical protein [bacterium]